MLYNDPVMIKNSTQCADNQYVLLLLIACFIFAIVLISNAGQKIIADEPNMPI